MVDQVSSPAGRAILLVEDDPTFASYLTKRLTQAGYVVEWAPDGLRALAQLRRAAPDLLLMDLAIPALDGLSLLQRLRDETLIAGVPVIVLTGRFSASDVEQATALGVADYIAKPFDETAFLASIAAHIGR
jgi:DNA-binding response OmpR family regulator